MAKRPSTKRAEGKRAKRKVMTKAATMTFSWTAARPEDPEARRLRADLAGRAMEALIVRGMNFTGEGGPPAWPSLVADMAVRFADCLIAKLGEPVERTWEKLVEKERETARRWAGKTARKRKEA